MITGLRDQADKIGASTLEAPFDGTPETAWDVVQELLNQITTFGGEQS